MPAWIYIIPFLGIVALSFALFKASWVNQQEAGTERMIEISGYVRDGAMAFLKREYRILSVFVLVVAVLLAIANWNSPDSSPIIAISFILGAFSSALAGFFGMRVATNANVRTTNAARFSLNRALQVAFSAGTVMGMCVVGLGVLGLGLLLPLYSQLFQNPDGTVNMVVVINVITGFSFGASSIALFARVGGGIYTKAADVGADLVGKVEAGIPEDDPRNPATIADNVGDNVGDVAGMGADLFESFVGSIVGTMVLGIVYQNINLILLPLFLAGLGILCSIIGTFAVRTKEGGNPQTALNLGTFGAGALVILFSYPLINYFVPDVAVPSTNVTGLLKALSCSKYFSGNNCWSVSRNCHRFDNRVLYGRIQEAGTKYSGSITNRRGNKYHRGFSAWDEINSFTRYLYRNCDCRIILLCRIVRYCYICRRDVIHHRYPVGG